MSVGLEIIKMEFLHWAGFSVLVLIENDIKSGFWTYIFVHYVIFGPKMGILQGKQCL